MRWGEGWGMYYGSPDVWFIVLKQVDLVSGVAVTFLTLSGFSQFAQLVIDGINVGEPVFCTGGSVTTLTGSYQFPANPHVVSIEGLGPFATNQMFDVSGGQILFASSRPDRLHLEITAVPNQFSVAGV